MFILRNIFAPLVIFFLIGIQIALGQQIDSSINKESIDKASKIIGLEFTDAELDSMQSSLMDQLKNYQKIREVFLNNDIPMALQFNPIPNGFSFSQSKKPVQFSNYSGVKMPADKNDLAFFTIGKLAHLIRTKQITSLELTNFFIDRLKKYSSMLYSVVTLTEERAISEAKIADEEIAKGNYKGLLHGIPYGVKDLFSTEKYKTTWGAEPFADQLIDEDATVISKLKKAGAVLVAKLSMGALARGDVWFGGFTRNPWDTTKGSSGSSAGSASSVAAGLLPFALGTETRGSIISPATICGVAGLRPTYGRVSRWGAMTLSWTMDKVGVITRYSEDLAIVFNSIYGLDPKDNTLYDFPFNYKPAIDLKKLRVGYLKSDFEKQYPFHKNDSLSLKKIEELGVNLIPIELPNIASREIGFILLAESAAVFDELTRSNKDDLLKRQTKNSWPNSFRFSRLIPAVEYINANRIRYLLIHEMKKIFDQVDLYIAPSWQGLNLSLTNLTGHPAVVVPNGFVNEGTLSSITFMGNLFDEARLLAFAKLFQDSTGFHKNHPKLK